MKPTTKVIITDLDGKLLVLRRSDTHPLWPHRPDLPGGEIEENEEIKSGVAREILEETGLIVEADSLEILNQSVVDGRESIILSTKISEHQPPIKLSWEHDRYSWVNEEELKQSIDIPNSDPILIRVATLVQKN